HPSRPDQMPSEYPEKQLSGPAPLESRSNFLSPVVGVGGK
ncbi:hypothetical protein TNCV_844341, partial [Trichonephila clavipes]